VLEIVVAEHRAGAEVEEMKPGPRRAFNAARER